MSTFTGCNGTHCVFLRFQWDELMAPMGACDAAHRLYEATRDFPGWRTVHVEWCLDYLSVEVDGGWYDDGSGRNPDPAQAHGKPAEG